MAEDTERAGPKEGIGAAAEAEAEAEEEKGAEDDTLGVLAPLGEP